MLQHCPRTLQGWSPREGMLSGAESCIFTSVPWMRKTISPRSLANSRLIGMTFLWMISCSSSPLSRKESFEECSNKKQLVRGLGAVRRKLKLLCSSREVVVWASGRKRLIACPIVGRRASTLAECRWVRCKQIPSTCTASLQGPGICGSHWNQIGDSWLHTCILTGQVYTPMRKSMTDYLSILDGMTISKIRRQRQSGIRLPICNGLASVNICGNSSMHRFPLSELPWKTPLLNIVLTSELSKLRLQHIHRLPVEGRNGRRKMGSINWKIQRSLNKLCQPLMMPCVQTCFGMCERQLLVGLQHWGEHLREALRGASSLRFTVSPASISNFLGVGCFVFVWFLFGFLFWVCVFVLLFVCVSLTVPRSIQ